MPPKTRSNRRPGASAPLKSIKTRTPLSTTRSQAPPSSGVRKWRTSGAVDKQSTLTQIDFLHRPEHQTFEDFDLDFENDTTLLPEATTPPNRKRKRVVPEVELGVDTAAGNTSTKRLRSQKTEDDKENDTFVIPMDDEFLPVQGLKTPSKTLRWEVPSSQSPTTPLSIRKPKRYVRSVLNTPLKDVSVNIRRTPRFAVEDTFATSHQLSSSPCMGPTRQARINSECDVEESRRTSDASYESVGRIRQTFQMEIQDSDEEISDIEPMNSSGPTFDLDDTTFVEALLPELDQARNDSPSLPDADADIMKPPISDDSRHESIGLPVSGLAANSDPAQEEANTLEDTVIIRPRRRYSTKRRYSLAQEVSSSLSFQEVPSSISILESIVSEVRTEKISSPRDVPSSPHLASDPGLIQVPSSQSSQVEVEIEVENQEGPDHDPLRIPSSQPLTDLQEQSDPPVSEHALRSSSPIATDSQQAVAQLQQESQWQAPIFRPSQATTASIQSSPIKEASASSSSIMSNRRGWFFNPLTDSQLLPDSIMNFELPRFSAILGGKAVAAAVDDNDHDEE